MAKPGKITAMISSTAADLPEHRKQAFDACLRVGVFPIGMEHLPARDGTGIQASLEMVDQADIYIGRRSTCDATSPTRARSAMCCFFRCCARTQPNLIDTRLCE